MIPSDRNLTGLAVAALMALPAVALAQDSDGDGVANASDAYPCDAARASVTYFPGQSSSALLAFEDQWPNHTDVDYNDVAVRAHFRLERNAAGNVVQLVAVLDPVALGGDFSNGLGLQLPTSRTGVTARRRVGGGAWQALTLESDANATLIVSGNLRELFGNASGRINSIGGQPRLSGQRIELELTFASPAALPAAAAPFDVFVFRSGNPGHQIHFPQYAGTAAMNTALFNSDQDRSTATRRFVTGGGVPAALNLMTSTRYPLEGVGISSLFPDIAGFAASGGTTNAAFYSSAVVAAQGHDVAAPALPAEAAPDTACTAPQTATLSTLNFNGMTNYPLHLDRCTPNIGACCAPTTTQQQMDAFCVLAGYSRATSWVMQTLPSTNCYCWGACSNNRWLSNCCGGQDNRNFITSVTCTR